MAWAPDRFQSSHQELAADLHLTPVGVKWFAALLLISFLLLLTTVTYHLGLPLFGFSHKFALTQESNAATSWAGALLALAAVHAYDGYVAGESRNAVRGWAAIALVLLALSADEMGSLHERVGDLGDTWGVGTWTSLLPFAVILGGALLYGLSSLWTTEPRRRVLLLLIGFLLMASAALHEVVEHRVVWSTPGAKALRGLLEEGSEIAGSILVLMAVAQNTAGIARSRLQGHPAFEAVSDLRTPSVAMAVVLIPGLAYLSASFTDLHLGMPANWAAAMGCLAAALVVVRHHLAAGTGMAWQRWAFCAVCVLANLVVTDVDPVRTEQVGPASVNLRIIALAVLAFLASAIWVVDAQPQRGSPALFGVAIFVALACLSLLPVSTFVTFFVSQLFGLTLWLLAAAGFERRAADPTPG